MTLRVLLVALVLLATPAWGQFGTLPGQAPAGGRLRLTRQDAMRLALRRSPELLTGLSQLRAARTTVELQYVPVRPQLAFTTELDHYLVGGPDESDSTLTLSQTLTTFGRVKWNAEAARMLEKQTAQDYRAAVEALFQRVDTEYLNTLLALEQVRISQELVQRQADYVQTSENLWRAGLVAEYDVVQNRSNLLQARQALQAAQLSAQLARASLLADLGLRPDLPVELEEVERDPQPPPRSIEPGLARALNRRPELAALRWAVKAAEAQVEAEARVNAPTLSLDTEYEGTGDTNVDFANQWSTSLVLTVPILDGGEARLRKKVAQEAVEQSRQAVEAQRRSVELDVASAYANLVGLWEQVATARNNVAMAQEASSIAELRYSRGISSNVELLSSQQNYISARQILANVTMQYRVALVAWRRSVSGEWPLDLPQELLTEWELP